MPSRTSRGRDADHLRRHGLDADPLADVFPEVEVRDAEHTNPMANGRSTGARSSSPSPLGAAICATEAIATAIPIPLNSPVVCSRMLCQLVS